ncbi:subtilisin-like protein [Lactarius akahatsu]|uniref:tripeptidyl-peptidase II n=1 Tax=Lactarius akahatsu TaxID=416441 RepID=A0AAD4QEW1_9AGAM|nr:subtilisin-like protein [Lactarius akahatsu]
MQCHPLRLFVLSILAAALLGGLATPLAPRWNETKVKHAWHTIPENWVDLGHPSAGTTIDLHLALKSHDEDALIDALYEVSDPDHPRYRSYLSKEQVADLVAPHADTLELINSWLKHFGIPPSSVSRTLGSWLTLTGVPVSQANDILCASYQLYNHVETNHTVLRTISYSIPEALHEHIHTIVPTTYFGSPPTEGRKLRMHPNSAVWARAEAGSEESVKVLSSRDLEGYVSSSYVRWLYNTAGYRPAAVDRNVIGIAGYDEQYPSPKDLGLFMTEFRTDGEDATFSVVQVQGGGNDPDTPGIEANLDTQYSGAMTYPTTNVFYSTGGALETLDPFVNFLFYMLTKETRIPQTITTSYGGPEYNFPLDYATRVCRLFAELGLRGVSAFFASGDSGVGKGNCLFEVDGHVSVHFIPEFPATCPYLTSVGGTTNDSPEVAASLSGGGFSKYFARPPYQANAVPPFLQTLGDKYQGYYNPNGRGVPDISAQALKFFYFHKGRLRVGSGTSAATPIAAGIFSLLDDYLISTGNGPLGFLNGWLYGSGLPGLNDIISGSNPGCDTDGFTAIAGWDPVTGLGTPDFTKLEDIIDEWSPPNLGASSTTNQLPTETA